MIVSSFEFGSAGGHPHLAADRLVLMAGEIEVDAEGKLTRWLNKSGFYMPPRLCVGQSGLPFSTAWLYVADAEAISFTFLSALASPDFLLGSW